MNTMQPAYDLAQLRQEFPILSRQINGQPLVYLDNAATSQKPEQVIQTLSDYYRHTNANIHRGLHSLSQEATDAHEAARVKVQNFIQAAKSTEIIFTRGATESINLVAQSWGRSQLQAGDKILVSMLEHHANIVPWQLLAQEKQLQLEVIPILPDGSLDMAAYKQQLSSEVKLVTVTQASNALGTLTPIQEIIQLAHQAGALVLVDGAQAVPHQRVNVAALDADFYVFSGHKMYAPTGIGVLYAKEHLLEIMPPWQAGGDMIEKVSFTQGTSFAALPHKFEAGTPAIGAALGLGAAISWLERVGLDAIDAWEQQLLAYASEQMQLHLPNLRILGTAPHKVGVISFVFSDVHAQDLGLLADQFGVALRTGHHCAMPVLNHLGVDATARISFAAYNTPAEIDTFIQAVLRIRQMLL